MTSGDGVLDDPSGPVDRPVPAAPPTGAAGAVPPDDESPHTRRERLREAAIMAEYATGRQEATEEEARRNVFLRMGTIVVGFVVLGGGLAMMVLPGPGILGILAGLGILSRELPWAERLMESVRERAKLDELKEQPRWVQVLMWTITAVAVLGSMTYFLVIR